MRVRTVFIAAMTAGLIAAVSSSGSSFAKSFWFIFWAASTCVVLIWVRLNLSSKTIADVYIGPDIDAEQVESDPWVDQDGVIHFPGDVFDIENNPTPGAHGHI